MSISITRGDTPSFTVSVTDAAGAPYELKDGDRLTFTVKKSTKPSDPAVMQRVMDSHTGPSFQLTAEETSIEYGTYRYDVELQTAGGGTYTVVKPDKLTITEEVTTHDQ